MTVLSPGLRARLPSVWQRPADSTVSRGVIGPSVGSGNSTVGTPLSQYCQHEVGVLPRSAGSLDAIANDSTVIQPQEQYCVSYCRTYCESGCTTVLLAATCYSTAGSTVDDLVAGTVGRPEEMLWKR